MTSMLKSAAFPVAEQGIRPPSRSTSASSGGGSNVHPDSKELARWIVNGMLAGGSIASVLTLARWIRLHRELKKYDKPTTAPGSKDSLVVDIPNQPVKQAFNTGPELAAGAIGGGVAAYMAATWLANKIENMRMKKLEEKARREAVEAIVSKGASEKKAGAVSDFLRSQNLWAALAFLAAAHATRKRLDAKARQSDDIKTIAPDKVVFRQVEEEE